MKLQKFSEIFNTA